MTAPRPEARELAREVRRACTHPSSAKLVDLPCLDCIAAALNTLMAERDALTADRAQWAFRAGEEAGERWKSEVLGRRLAEALRGIMVLFENGQLVRNITNDSHFPSFVSEATRLVKALKAADDALASPEVTALLAPAP